MLSAVVGINWGDEGKGRMVDFFASSADFVVRYQGGNNAGHTVINPLGTFKLSLLPSGVFSPDAVNVLGPGMVINPEALATEFDALVESGVKAPKLVVSERASVAFPFHRDEDNYEEERLLHGRFGSTGRGIAPAYGDRYLKRTLMIGEFSDPDILSTRLKRLVDTKNALFRGLYGTRNPIDVDEVIDWSTKWYSRISHFIGDTTKLLSVAMESNANILLEGQLGALRDIYYGIYPYTTSSCTLASFGPIGAGIPGAHVERVIGVMKAFSTCVGEGPFVTELDEARQAELRESAGEYGAATGRPRRIGDFDGVASRYGIEAQGATDVALTKLDSLSGLAEVRICVAYDVNGRVTTDFPAPYDLTAARPVLESMRGWDEDISQVRKYADLPRAARDYVEAIERNVGRRIRYISVGPERSQLIIRDDL